MVNSKDINTTSVYHKLNVNTPSKNSVEKTKICKIIFGSRKFHSKRIIIAGSYHKLTVDTSSKKLFDIKEGISSKTINWLSKSSIGTPLYCTIKKCSIRDDKDQIINTDEMYEE